MVRVGCCGWPVARARYCEALDVVEVQQTFYRLPGLATAQRWRAAVPPGFTFTMKAPQLITHEPSSPTYRRLGRRLGPREAARCGGFKPTPEVAAAWTAALDVARALRAPIVVFQCPASFTPTPTHVRRLARFFERAPRDGLRLAWEPRGPWPDERVRDLCRRLDLIHCADPFDREPLWGEPAYLRLHGLGGYRYAYTDEDLRRLAARVRELGRAWVLFNNVAMWEDARRFRRLLGARGGRLPGGQGPCEPAS